MNPLPIGLLKQFIDRAQQLYTLPQVAMEVLELTSQPTVDTRALKNCIENDPALTSRLLRVVNSSMYGLSREVKDLTQALSLLGCKPLKLLVLGFSLPPNLLESVEAEVLATYWRRSLTTAVASREICRRWLHADGDEAFIAGLLKTIGMLVLIQQLGEQYVTFLEQVNREGGDLMRLESSTLGFDHHILSARLLESWGLPETLPKSIAVCHDGARIANLPEDKRQLPQILHTAGLLCELVTLGKASILPGVYTAAGTYYDADQDSVDELILELQGHVDSLAGVLSLQLPPGIDVEDLLASAQQKLAETSLAIAVEEPPHFSSQTIAAQTALAAQASATSTTERKPRAAARFRTRTLPPTQTGSGSREPGVQERIKQALMNCRNARTELSLLLLEVDAFEDVVLRRGFEAAKQLTDVMETAIGVMNGISHVVHQGDGKFAILLEGCDRTEAVELARGLHEGLKAWAARQSNAGAISFSSGVATVDTPPPNFRPEDILEPARRCVYGSRATGGNLVKSIDLL